MPPMDREKGVESLHQENPVPLTRAQMTDAQHREVVDSENVLLRVHERVFEN